MIMSFKKLNFLFLSSLLGLTLISCGNEDNNTTTPPTAGFEFEIDELTVKFSNTSTNAISYIWTFGDGSTSTEAEPTHTYAESGTYQVELFATNSTDNTNSVRKSVTVSRNDDNGGDPLPEISITLDGEFDDWDAIPEEYLAIAILDEAKSDYHRLKEVRLVADPNYIYMYMKLDVLHANAMDIYLNIDGDTETGYNSWMWNQTAGNYLMQGFYAEDYDMRLAAYDETKGGGWGWLTPNIVEKGMGLMVISPMKGVSENIYEFEAQISRQLIPGLGDEVKIMIGHSGVEGDSWTTSGGLPTVTNSGDKNEGLVVRLK